MYVAFFPLYLITALQRLKSPSAPFPSSILPDTPPSLSPSQTPTNPTHSISGRMTAALSLYSAVFMRYAVAVSPANYLLFGCHAINCTSQLVQGYRYLNYWNWGGREAKLAQENKIAGGVEAGADAAKGAVSQALEKAKETVGKK